MILYETKLADGAFLFGRFGLLYAIAALWITVLCGDTRAEGLDRDGGGCYNITHVIQQKIYYEVLMPPKVRITREDIVNTAVDIVRFGGAEAVNARRIAERLNCSTQPVFSNFSSMEALRGAVMDAADKCYREYIRRETETGAYPVYKASGMAYIRFAREEKELFKLLFMRDRAGEDVSAETDELKQIYRVVQSQTGLEGERAKRFHLETWAFVHGIAAMTATGYLELDTDLVSEMLTDAYQSLKARYEKGGLQ